MKAKRGIAWAMGFLALVWVFLHSSSHDSAATSIKVTAVGSNVFLSWPTGATGYSLQVRDTLDPTGLWHSVTGTPVIVGTENVVTRLATNYTQFFRLISAGPSPPVLSSLTAPSTLPLNATSLVTFAYADPDSDISALEVTLFSELGASTNTVPVSALKIKGPDGQLTLPLKARKFPFGTNLITLRLKDSGGRFSVPVDLAFAVVGESTGGTAPSVQVFSPVISYWNLPTGPSDRLQPAFALSYSDPDGDIERVRVNLTDPNGRQTGQEFLSGELRVTGTSGTVTNPVCTFRSTDEEGTYTVTATLIDRNGNISQPASAYLSVFALGGAEPLSVTSFSPTQGAAGAPVVLRGTGFDVVNPSKNLVTLYGRPVVVTGATSNTLSVIVPTGASSGRFSVRSENGVAFSTSAFTVPAAVTLSPATADVVVKGRQQFEAAIVSAPDFALAWSVNDIPGGDTTVGTISPGGVYVAPMDVPTNRVVTVSARLVANTNIVGQATINVLPPPLTPGAATVLSSSGGTVHSLEGRTSVTIPPPPFPATQLSLSPPGVPHTSHRPQASGPLAAPASRLMALPSGSR